MILIIINIIILLVLSLCLFGASDTCENALHYKSKDYDNEEYFRKKLIIQVYYVTAFLGLLLSMGEIFLLLLKF